MFFGELAQLLAQLVRVSWLERRNHNEEIEL